MKREMKIMTVMWRKYYNENTIIEILIIIIMKMIV